MAKKSESHGEWIIDADFEAAENSNEECPVELGITKQPGME